MSYVGHVSLALSLLGLIGVTLVAHSFGTALGYVGVCLAFLSLPGLICGVAGLFTASRRLSVWGIVLGIFVLLHVPTILLSVMRHLGR